MGWSFNFKSWLIKYIGKIPLVGEHLANFIDSIGGKDSSLEPTVVIPLAEPPVRTYIGHEKKIDAYNDILNADGRLLIYGLGGLGKTALTLKLADKHYKGHARFLRAESVKKALESCVIGGTLKADEKVRLVLEDMRKNLTADDLLILDDLKENRNERELVGEMLSLDCKVLITSRIRFDSLDNCPQEELPHLNDTQCFKLFRAYHLDKGRNYDAEQRSCVKEIVKRTANHTITLELLAKTCKASRKQPSEILDRMKETGFSLEDIPETVRHGDRDARLIEHLKLLFDVTEVRKKHKELLPLMKRLCVLSVRGADIHLVKKLCREASFNGLNKLNKLGWIQINEANNTVTVHDVISETLRLKFNSRFSDIQDTARALYDELESAYKKNEYAYTPAIDHAEAILKAIKEDEKLLGDIALDAGLLTYNQADYNRALEFYNKALTIREKKLGADHPDTATTYNNIGGVYKNMGDFVKALEFYNKALAVFEKVLGTDHPYTATTYNNIGTVYDDIGDYDNALEFYNKALAVFEKVLGTDHPDTAATYNNIGAVYKNMGDNDKALEFYNKALAVKEKVLGADHPSTAATYNNIGSVYKNMGDYSAAARYEVKALQIFIGHNLEHMVKIVKNNLRNVYTAMNGEFSEEGFETWLGELLDADD